jgi:hypothetical protein
MNATTYFSASYAEARVKFLGACDDAGIGVTESACPAHGPGGEALHTSVARIGPLDAERVLIACSGTHGVEGFCGSGTIVGLLRARIHREIPAGLAVVLVHAINPNGFAHERRVNEDNIDLNRNTVAHDESPHGNPAYDEIHDLLVPADWDGPARAAADRGIADYIARHGERHYQAVVTGGQYEHADGLFYGGRAPTWSNRLWHRIVREHTRGARHVAFVDFHTGLGPRGYGEPICKAGPKSPAFARARAWYGADVTSTMDDSSTSAEVRGDLPSAFADAAPDAQVTAISLEFGTRPLATVLDALRADNWLYLHGKVDSPLGREIKAAIRDAFYGEDDAWKNDVWERAADICRRALRGLSQG